MSNKNSLDKLIDGLNKAINKKGLSKLNPTFALKPQKMRVDKARAKNFLSLCYDGAELSDPYDLSRASDWTILTNEGFALRFEEHSIREEKVIHTEDADIGIPKVTRLIRCEYFFIQDAPIYIRFFYDAVKSMFKKSLINISERLPLGGFYVAIFTNFNSEKAKQVALEEIARHTVISNNDAIKVESIISDNKKSFKERLDEIVNLSSATSAPPDYSYCLCCGARIKKNTKFCDATNSEKNYARNKDNCLFKFKYWVSSRLGIKDTAKNRAKREEFGREMQALVHSYRISAYERFVNNHPILYQSKKPGRKPKKKM